MDIFDWIHDALGYGEAETAARKARIEAQRLEDERQEQELLKRAMLYNLYNNDPPILKLINNIRFHPKMRHAYIKPLIGSILVALLELLHIIDVLT